MGGILLVRLIRMGILFLQLRGQPGPLVQEQPVGFHRDLMGSHDEVPRTGIVTELPYGRWRKNPDNVSEPEAVLTGRFCGRTREKKEGRARTGGQNSHSGPDHPHTEFSGRFRRDGIAVGGCAGESPNCSRTAAISSMTCSHCIRLPFCPSRIQPSRVAMRVAPGTSGVTKGEKILSQLFHLFAGLLLMKNSRAWPCSSPARRTCHPQRYGAAPSG